jgi:hypothetical protein
MLCDFPHNRPREAGLHPNAQEAGADEVRMRGQFALSHNARKSNQSPARFDSNPIDFP